MLRSGYYDYSDAYTALKGRVTVEGTNAVNRRIVSHLDHAYQKLITHL